MSVSHGIWECSPGHGWMQLGGNKYINAGPSAVAFGNAHLDTDECTCPERNKKMQVHWPLQSGMLTGTRMDVPGWKERNKCRSIGHGIRECSLGHGWMQLHGNK